MARGGLSMAVVENSDADGASLRAFAFEHAREYQEVQLRFFEAVESMDPAAIAAVLRAHPYHLDSLLQLSDVYGVQGDPQGAADLVERALYRFERALHPLCDLASRRCRLAYER